MKARLCSGCTVALFLLAFILPSHALVPAIASGSPSLAGCPVFPADNVWNTPVDSLPVSPNSTAYINTIGASRGLHPDFGSGLWEGAPIGIPLNIVSGSQPKVNITFEYEGESDPGPYPIPANPQIEGGNDSDGDRHILVLDRDSCRLYETFSTYPAGNNTWEAGSGAVYDLSSNRHRPRGWTSADAAGLPILPGLVRYDEVAAGEINHALRFTTQPTKREFVWPGRHFASSQTEIRYPPMGQRFRLKAGFDISQFSPEVQVLLRALKKYGMILADNGSPWYISGMPDERWDNDVLVSELSRVKGSDFEAVDGTALMIAPDSGRAAADLDPNPPANPVRMIFIHHSTGQNWLNDGNGGLGSTLRDNNYFVSDTNYGWGPDGIGNNTDIGHWWNWFRGPDAAGYLAALYGESGQNSSYSRLSTVPSGENEIIMFKSCFPNSALSGSPDGPVPAIGDNPLRGQSSGSPFHTVANAKGIYMDLLEYFRTRQDKLFVVITAPPLTDGTYAANARAFNQWLVNEWLNEYPYRNVAVFDFYNVLTTNGGNSNTNDLNLDTGNHHRWRAGGIRHETAGDNDSNPNILEYPVSSGDDHPSRAGNLKATGEFVSLLNVYYHLWKGGDITPPALTLEQVTTPTDLTGQTIGGVTEAGATVTVSTDTAASDGPATVTGTDWSYTITGLAAGPNNVTVTAGDAAGNTTVRAATIIRNPGLAVTLAGDGRGTVTSSPPGIACDTDCSAAFGYGSDVILSAVPAEFSLFSGWPGVCAVSPEGDCTITMSSDLTVNASFMEDSAHKTLIDGSNPASHFSTLQDAYDAAPANGTVKAWRTDFHEDLSCARDKSITIRGGYDGDYGNCNGYTSLYGSMSVYRGVVSVENMIIR